MTVAATAEKPAGAAGTIEAATTSTPAAAAVPAASAPAPAAAKADATTAKTETVPPVPNQPGKITLGQDPAAAAPAKPIDYKLAPPKDSALEAGDIERILGEARAENLSQEAAQALVQREHDTILRFQAKQKATTEVNAEKWSAELRGDHELGGAKLDQTLKLTNAALRRFDRSGQITRFLNETGLSNNREWHWFLNQVKKAMRPDSFMGSGDARVSVPRDPKDVLFGSPTHRSRQQRS